MTDQQNPGSEPVGSVAEEAAKLFAALSDVARDKGAGFGGAASAAASGVSGAFHDVNEHLASGEDCKYCPLCQVIRLVRDTDPEVKAHLAIAANSLVQAAAGLLSTKVPTDQKDPGVEKIDVDGDDGDWEG